nr:DnaJ domain-containing protein [Campylobacter novaezeelandiae]
MLQCQINDDFETIKKNYRKLAKEYHYDSLNSKEIPPKLLKIAQEMMRKINLAYEIIKQARGI